MTTIEKMLAFMKQAFINNKPKPYFNIKKSF